MNKLIVLLVFILIVIVGLFSFSFWTNAKVVTEDLDLSPGFDLASKFSPALIGFFVALGLGVVVLISVKV